MKFSKGPMAAVCVAWFAGNAAAAVPSILGFTPVSATAGSQVTISGLNFDPVRANNLVWFGAVAAPVVSASATTLVVTVPAGAIFGPITVNVSGLVAYAARPFTPTFLGDGSPIGTNTFGAPLNLATGPYPLSVAIADLDGDGKPDLVVADTYAHYLSVFRNISAPGALAFEARVDLPPIPEGCCPANPNFISVADVDGDGRPDILVTDWVDNKVLIYPNISLPGVLTTNSFAAPVALAVYGDLINVRVADLDGDGRPDIITANDATRVISILHNVGAPGNLTTNSFEPHFDLVTGGNPFDVAVADLDGDGKPDLAVANASTPYVSLFRNVSVRGTLDASSFEARVDLPGVTNGWAISAVDVDGDGLLDLVDGSHNGGGLAMYRNLGATGSFSTSSFAPMVEFLTAGGVSGIDLGDLNGDGQVDVLGGGSAYQNQASPGGFTTNSLGARVDLATGAIGDLDGDGRPDIVATYYGGISIFANQSPFGGPPVILTQPAGLATPVNTTATFNVFVSGKSPLAYHWFFQGTNVSDGGRISGSGTSSLSISNIQTADAGSCYVIVTNVFGSATSLVASLTPVVLPPGFTEQPSSQTNIAGSNITFTAAISGSEPLSCRWYFNGSPMADGGRISGAATNALSITAIQVTDAGGYQLVVSNAANVATSQVATLTVLVPPSFDQPPTNQAVMLGSNAVFAAVVEGTQPLGFQWFFNGTPLADNGHVTGSAATTLAIADVQPPDVGTYELIVSNSAGLATSSVALAISTPLILGQPPASRSVLGGASVSIGAGVSGSPPLAYQWLFNGTPLDGATNNPLVLTSVLVSQSGTYSLVVTNDYGSAVSSNSILNVAALGITAQPTNRAAWLHGSAAFRVTVTGQGPFGFDWQFNGADIPGSNTNLLVLTNLQAAQFGTYSVIASNQYGSVSSSNAALVLSEVAVWGGTSGESNLISGLTNIVAVCGGSYGPLDCLALKSDGTTLTWPRGPAGFPPAASNLISITSAGFEAQNFGLKSDGTVVSWFFNAALTVPGFTNIAAITPNDGGNLGLRADGTLVVGIVVGMPPPIVKSLTNVVATSGGYQHTLALLGDGTMVGWGDNFYGQTNVPLGLSNVIAIAAGGYHSLALKGDGTVAAWGRDSNHESDVPSGLSNVVAIAGGGYHSLALKSDGTVVAWGQNNAGQASVPAGLTNVVAIAAGEYHSLAIIGTGPPITQVELANPTLAGTGFSVGLPTRSGRVYLLQFKNSLTDSNWTGLPLVPGTGNLVILTDPSATNGQRFYRVEQW